MNVIEKLIVIANNLDKKGLYKEAEEIDNIIKRMSLKKTAAMTAEEFKKGLNSIGYGVLASAFYGENDIKTIISNIVKAYPSSTTNRAFADLVYKATGIAEPLSNFKSYNNENQSNEQMLAKIKNKSDGNMAGEGKRKDTSEKVKLWQQKYNEIIKGSGIAPLKEDGIWGEKTNNIYELVKKIGWDGISNIAKKRIGKLKQEDEKKQLDVLEKQPQSVNTEHYSPTQKLPMI